MTRRVELVFDGGSLGNPGRGYGSFRWREHGGDWSLPQRLEFGEPVTNNEAEYRSLIAGLTYLVRTCPDPSETVVRAITDSRLVAEQLGGRWKLRAANLVGLHATARALATKFARLQVDWWPRERIVELLGH